MAEMATNVKFVKEVQRYPCLYNADIAAYSRKDITEEAWNQIGRIMNMTAMACKDKWRNLRVVFIRHLKHAALSDKKRKPYYLFDEMQYIIPYLKLNFPIPKDLLASANLAIQNNEQFSESDKYESYKDYNNCLNNELLDDIKEEIDDSSSDTYNENEQIRDPQIRKRSRDECDAYPSNYKKSIRLEPVSNEIVLSQDLPVKFVNSSNQNVPLEQPMNEGVGQSNNPVISFLNSILPELNEMNSKQFKVFKRRVLSLIDDIKPDDD